MEVQHAELGLIGCIIVAAIAVYIGDQIRSKDKKKKGEK